MSFWTELVPSERHEQRVFAFVIIVESMLLLICVCALVAAMFLQTDGRNTEAMTALVSITNMLIGSFATLMAARGILKKQNGEPLK
jgi:hypothetical protein